MIVTQSDFDTMVFDLLERGNDDWCTDTEVFSVVIEYFGQGEYQNQTKIVMRILEIVLTNSYMAAGYYDNAVGFIPWKEDCAAILQKVEKELSVRESIPVFGEVFWVAITPKGKEKYKAAVLLKPMHN